MAEKRWTEDEVMNLMEEKFGDLPMSEARLKAECWIIDHNGWLPNEDKDEIKKSIKEATKGAKSTDKKKREYKPREKDKEKLELISKMFDYLSSFAENVEVTNEQKEISFKIGENDYSISLIRHRKPKN